jgi:ferredoxin
LDETRITFDEKVCTRCEICVKACPVGAIEID